MNLTRQKGKSFWIPEQICISSGKITRAASPAAHGCSVSETDHYEALRDYPEDGHARDRFWFMYDGDKREFFTIARTFKDDADGQVRSLNTAPGLMIQDGSRVNIDYVELADGKELERLGTSGAGVDVVIGSGTSIGDFEEQLIGRRVGETFTIDVVVPADYYLKDIAGDTVTFQITVNGIYV